METESLDNILNGESEPVAASEPVEAAPSAPAAPARDEQGRFTPKGDNPEPATEPEASAPPAPQEEEPAHIPIAALKDERSKRQQSDARVAELERQIAQLQPPPAAQVPQVPQTVPDRWEDPEGYDRWLVTQATQQARAEAVAAAQEERIRVSAQAMRESHEDFDDKVKVFGELVQANPGLEAQLRQHPNPAEFAYSTAKTHLEVSQYGSIDALIEARKKEWEQTALSELQSKLPKASAPPTLSNERNVGSRSGPAWEGPKPLTALLGPLG